MKQMTNGKIVGIEACGISGNWDETHQSDEKNEGTKIGNEAGVFSAVKSRTDGYGGGQRGQQNVPAFWKRV